MKGQKKNIQLVMAPNSILTVGISFRSSSMHRCSPSKVEVTAPTTHTSQKEKREGNATNIVEKIKCKKHMVTTKSRHFRVLSIIRGIQKATNKRLPHKVRHSAAFPASSKENCVASKNLLNPNRNPNSVSTNTVEATKLR